MNERQVESAVDAAKEALATAEPARQLTLADYIQKQRPAIEAALPRNVDVDRFSRIVLTTIRTNPQLARCEPMSVLAAVMQAAQLGLEPGSGLGEAYIIPYKAEATFQIGYRGVAKLAHNSGDVSMVEARAVFTGDSFEVQLGTDPFIKHVPAMSGTERTFDNLTHVYCVWTMKDGTKLFDWMPKDEVEKHRDRYSKGLKKRDGSPSDSPWNDNLGAVEMAKKTVVIRSGKMVPLSAEVSRAFAADGAVRHELSADMSLVPDKEREPVEASALGVDDVIEVQAEVIDQQEPETAPFFGDGEEVPWPEVKK